MRIERRTIHHDETVWKANVARHLFAPAKRGLREARRRPSPDKVEKRRLVADVERIQMSYFTIVPMNFDGRVLSSVITTFAS